MEQKELLSVKHKFNLTTLYRWKNFQNVHFPFPTYSCFRLTVQEFCCFSGNYTVFSYIRYTYLLQKTRKYGASAVSGFCGENGQKRVSLVLIVYKSLELRAGTT